LDLKSLLTLKTAALLHDPPHKSFLIVSPHEDFRSKHEQVAKSFRSLALNGTLLELVHPQANVYTRVYDMLASTIERKLVKYIEWPKGFYLPYNKLHNIFNPELVVRELTPPQDLDDKVVSVAKEINGVLRSIEGTLGSEGEDKKLTILYNTLFLLLEATWYSRELFPALADTRVPTHTVFDHTYAVATVANIVGGVRENYEPVIKGLYLFIDFPGVQKFISGGRKAGDFWAASWIASRVMWGVAEGFAFSYGFDVILSPTPRLNPYAANSLHERLSEAIPLEKLKGPGVKLLNTLKSYFTYPLIPATISLLLPQIDDYTSTPRSLVDRVKEVYVESWAKLVDEIDKKLEDVVKRSGREDGKAIASRLLLEKLREIRSVIEVPPQGVRIYAIDVGELYNAVLRCLEGELDKCRAVGLQLGEADFKRLEEAMMRIACRSQQRCDRVEELRRDLAFTLTWHLLHTRAVDLAKRFGEVAIPSTRPFWTYSRGSLNPIANFVGNWTPCTLCGSEPAVIKLAKKPAEGGEVTFDFQHSEGIPKNVPITDLEKREALENLEKLFKPGEALGPNCLLKRAVYTAWRPEVESLLKIASTEDVAFEWRADRLYRQASSRAREIAEKLVGAGKVAPSAIENVVNAVKSLLEVKVEKDIDIVAKSISASTEQRISSEVLVQRLSGILVDMCSHGVINPSTVFDAIAGLSPRGYRVEVAEKTLGVVRSFGDKGYRVGELCKALEIPTTFAIVRADADYVGDLYKGVKPLKLGEYMERLAKVLFNALMNHLSEDEASKISRGIIEITELFNAIQIDGVPVTPARTSALSLTLMLQALEDTKIVKDKEGHGLLVFSGGDDVLALVPPETALKTSFELRKSYEEDSLEISDNDTSVKVLRMHIPLGRSISVRFANIRDLMNIEIGKTYDLLEDVAKSVRWRSPNAMWEKDSIVVSDSRSGRVAVLPLRREDSELSVDGYGLALLVALGTLSSSIPEDFEARIGEAKNISSEALGKMFRYVLRRNVADVELNGKSLSEEIMRVLDDWIRKAESVGVEFRGESSNLLKEVSTLIAILRRYL
jgi:CRISPR-associated protein Cmr2